MVFEKPLRTAYNLLVLGAPVQAQLVVTRRCNLSCGYCTEYDKVSPPIPFEELCGRMDSLHRLRVAHITLIGGEPLMHPAIGELVAYGRRHSRVSITTNGFLISDKIIEKLNESDLTLMQVSIDAVNVDPTNFIQKTLKPLHPKLERLKELAKFDVHLAAVLCEQSKDDIDHLLAKAKEIGIPLSLSVVHDDHGHQMISGEPYVSLWEEYGKDSNHFGFSMIDYEYSKQLLRGEQPSWKCRAGGRSLYIDEFGNVQFCSAQRGRLNMPLAEYSLADVRAQSEQHKGCEKGCAVDCVFRDSQIDNDRGALVRTLLREALNHRNHRNHSA